MFGKIYLVTWNIFALPSDLTFGIYFVTYFLISIHELLLAMNHVFFDFRMYIVFLTFFIFEKGVFLSFSVLNMIEYKLLDFNLAHTEFIFMLLILGKLSNNLAYRIAISFASSSLKRKEEKEHKLIGFCSYLSYYESTIVEYPRLVLENSIETEMIEFYETLIGKVIEHIKECQRVTCFCKKTENIPDANKNRYVDIEVESSPIFNEHFLR